MKTNAFYSVNLNIILFLFLTANFALLRDAEYSSPDSETLANFLGVGGGTNFLGVCTVCNMLPDVNIYV